MEENTKSPTRWWQWVLVYPGLLLGLIGSSPTIMDLYKSIQYDIPAGEVSHAQIQNRLWRKNIDCQPTPFDWTTTVSDISVDAKVCPSGDILISAKSQEHENYLWIAIDDIANSPSYSAIPNLINTVYASDWAEQNTNQSDGVLICTRWIDNKQLLRRIATSDRGCFDEIINTYNGTVISKTFASCENTC